MSQPNGNSDQLSGNENQQQNSQQTQQQNSGGGNSPDGFNVTPQQLFDAVNALPERMAAMLKEQRPAPRQQNTQQNNGGNQQQNTQQNAQQTQQQEPGKPKSFSDWWFGK